MIFDILCYALAIAATLAIVGSHRTTQAPTTRPIQQTLDTLHTLREILPSADECFSTDTEATTVPDVIGDRLDAMEPATDEEPVEDFSDLLSISATAQGIDTRWLSVMGTHALRTLGVIEGIAGARRWAKAQAIATLQAHYALA